MSQHASVLTIDGVRSTGPPGPKSRGTQTREPVSIECALPITELFLGQLIAAASFLKRDSAIAQRRYNRGLTEPPISWYLAAADQSSAKQP